MKCSKCKKKFNIMLDECGSGITWSLFKCKHCGQLHAVGFYIPKEVYNDKEIIVFETKPIGYGALK